MPPRSPEEERRYRWRLYREIADYIRKNRKRWAAMDRRWADYWEKKRAAMAEERA